MIPVHCRQVPESAVTIEDAAFHHLPVHAEDGDATLEVEKQPDRFQRADCLLRQAAVDIVDEDGPPCP